MILAHGKLLNKTLATCIRNLSTTTALMKSHYETLEISRDATQAEIKNAYFRLTKMYHPDKIAATDENLKKFREISEAYEILGNEQSRKLYDGGLLGDIKRVGVDDKGETDPVIAFYKQRQDMSKILGVKPDGIGIWTQSNFSEAKMKKQHDLFSMKTKRGLSWYPISEEFFFVYYYFGVVFLIYTNFENSYPSNLMESIYAFLGI